MAIRKRKCKANKKKETIESSFEKMFAQSIRKIKANEKQIENAISKVLSIEDLKVTEAEYAELKKLTDTLNEIDSVLENL